MKKLLSLASLLLATEVCQAQDQGMKHLSAGKICSESKRGMVQQYQTTVADLAEDNYDIKHVKLDIELSNLSTYVTGNATTTAVVTASSLPVYVFELRSFLVVDSVKVNGQLLTATGAGTARSVTLPVALQQNDVFTAQVFYHGQPPSGPFSNFGIKNDESPSWGTQVTYTLSQPYAARDWWPTKQSLTDKIDSVDLWYTVPDTCKAGGNGILQNVVSVPGGKVRYEWKTRYLTDYYLISAAVAPYVDYSYYIHFPNSTDSVLYQNYIYSNPNTLPFWQQEIDSVADMMIHLSGLFGKYPFLQEKYGHCMAPLSGGMEHQTMTTQGFFSTTLSVHELGHQWFGDNVTCGTWKDIWLNEGFASYCEYLYVDHFWSHPQALAYMQEVHENVKSSPGGTVYVDDTTTDSRIFDDRLSYDKGSAIVHTLRFVFNNDSLFFATLRAYQQAFAFGTATTAEFEAFTEQALNQNMDTFFQQWIYKEGYPVYNARWEQTDTVVHIELTQLASVPSSQTLFHTPLEIKLQSPTGDTTVRIYNNQNVQLLTFNWNKDMTGMKIDPNNWIIATTWSVVNDPTLSVGETNASNIRVVPNPATDVWTITGMDISSQLVLSDMAGRTIWKGAADKSINIPAANLAPGMYVLQVNNKKQTASVKLVKQ